MLFSPAKAAPRAGTAQARSAVLAPRIAHRRLTVARVASVEVATDELLSEDEYETVRHAVCVRHRPSFKPECRPSGLDFEHGACANA